MHISFNKLADHLKSISIITIHCRKMYKDKKKEQKWW